jgi:hypothetical protein
VSPENIARRRAIQARYYQTHKAERAEYMRSRRKLGMDMNTTGLPKGEMPRRIKTLLKSQHDKGFSANAVAKAVHAPVDPVCRLLLAMHRRGEVIRTGVPKHYQYTYCTTYAPAKRQSSRRRTFTTPTPDFDTVAWLGSVIRGTPPGQPGRKFIAQEMQCVA